MDSLVITPSSEADLQLLTALFKKMKIKAHVVPNALPATKRPKVASTKDAADKLLPRTQAERNLVEAIEEMKEIRAGRKQAMSLDEFWQEVRGE
ncbi:MAG TPA: hypothetical protein VF630_17765 [Hymenobacter sp.]|jgi:hypothetical protein